MRLLVAFAAVLLASGSTGAEQTFFLPDGTERELETDRDAFAPATGTVGSGVSVLESSYSFIDNRTVAETH